MYSPNFKWMRLDVKNSEGKAWIKVLAKDPDNGASAALIKYDAGFSMAKATSTVFTDCLFLEGNMTLGDLPCRRLTYYYRPSGVEYGPIKVEQDVTRLVISGGAGESASDAPIFIEDVEGNEPHWEASPQGPSRSEKILRTDEKA